MTTTSFGVANNDIIMIILQQLVRKNFPTLMQISTKITTTSNTNSDTHSINKISNTIIRFNETNSTFFIITDPNGDFYPTPLN